MLFGVLYALLYAFFWPPSFTSMDESSYANMAWVYAHGTFYPDTLGLTVVNTFAVGGHEVCKYPPGMSLVLALVGFLGFKALLGFNLFVHLATYALVAAVLGRLALPRLYALLFLFHPTAVLLSRTLFSDPLSGLLIAAAFLLLLQRRFALAGLALGFAALTRSANAVVLPVFVLGVLAADGVGQWRKQVKDAVLLVLGALPGIAALGFYMVVVAHGEMAKHTGTFSLQYLPSMLPFYLVALSLLWPGMLLAPAVARIPYRGAIAATVYGFVGLYGLWYYRDQGGSLAESLVVGLRYFLAVLPLLVVTYVSLAERFFAKHPARRDGILSAVGVALLVVSLGIHQRHQRYLADLATARDAVLKVTQPGETIIANTQLAKLFHPTLGQRKVVLLTAPAEKLDAVLDQKPLVVIWERPGRSDDSDERKRFDAYAQKLTRESAPIGGASWLSSWRITAHE